MLHYWITKHNVHTNHQIWFPKYTRINKKKTCNKWLPPPLFFFPVELWTEIITSFWTIITRFISNEWLQQPQALINKCPFFNNKVPTISILFFIFIFYFYLVHTIWCISWSLPCIQCAKATVISYYYQFTIKSLNFIEKIFFCLFDVTAIW